MYDILKVGDELSTRMSLVRLFAIEVFKYINGINPAYLNERLVTLESNHDFRNQCRFILLQPKFDTYKYGYNSYLVRYPGYKVWNYLLSHLKTIDGVHDFRRKIYEWCLSDHATKMPA